jgi:2-keto-4-pentenoate hydratase/2-oxohepta-3-ene-1,7-dioic acid hydratase in catechol pathway
LVALAGGIGRLEDDGSVAVLDMPQPGLADLLCEPDWRSGVARAKLRSRMAFGEQLSTPIGTRSAVWGIGLNYLSKQAASGRSAPEHPVIFLKSAGAVNRTGIILPAAAPCCVDYEGEIAVLVCEDLFEATPAAATGAIGGVFAANDVTARDVMRQTGSPLLAKSFPGFGQFGAVLADPQGFGGFHRIALETRVNGELRQSDRGDGMILPVGELLSYISRFSILRPGDVVLTGTPAGTGDETGTYLAGGDVVEVTIGDLPALRSEVVHEEGRPATAQTAAGHAMRNEEP